MKLKQAVLQVMNRDALKDAVARLDIAGADRRSAEDMRNCLSRTRRATPADLLGRLKEPTVKAVCELMGIDGTGRKQALVSRLLSETGETSPAKRPAAPPSGASAKRPRPAAAKLGGSGATTGYEAELWRMADALRGSMDAAEYKHVVLGLIFLKYISDAFEERHAAVLAKWGAEAAEDRDEYTAENIFWVPSETRWGHLKAQARQPAIGQVVDGAMAAIERDNPALKDVLPKDYARPALDKQRLGQLIDMVGNIQVGNAEARSKDVLGRVYEYFLSQFASAEGKKGGEFYTPRCVVKLLVEMLQPYRGRVYDPCCGSAGMFVQSIEFIRAHATRQRQRGESLQRGSARGNPLHERAFSGGARGGTPRTKGTHGDISIYGQESNYTTWRLAKMNLAIRGIDEQIAQGDSFHDDRHPDLKADFILAKPPFNVSDWGGERLADDQRWRYGAPPKGNANFAWVQHMVHHLAPAGLAGFVLANGSMSSAQSGEGEIRKNLIEADLVDCMVALPGQLFYSTQIPACLWFLTRDRGNGKLRERRGEVLFIDARKLGRMVDRTHRELTDEDIARIADTYHAWRDGSQDTPSPLKGEGRDEGADTPSPLEGEGRGEGEKTYADVPGFCKSASLEEIRKHGHVLTPGRHVGAEPQSDDGEPFEDKMQRLVAQLREQQAEATQLDAAIGANLKRLGFGGD